MRLTIKYLTLFLLCTFFTCAQAESFKLSYETISHETMIHSEKYHRIAVRDFGTHKTIIRFSGLDEAKEYVFILRRPFLGNETRITTNKEIMINTGRIIEEDSLAYVVSSHGFLPGERVIVSVKGNNEAYKTEEIEFFPHPLLVTSSSGKGTLLLELLSVSPTNYRMIFKGIDGTKTMKMHSYSSGETLDDIFPYFEEMHYGYMPGVVGKKGGFSYLTLSTDSGETFQINPPWGEEVMKHWHTECFPVVSDFPTIIGNSRDLK